VPGHTRAQREQEGLTVVHMSALVPSGEFVVLLGANALDGIQPLKACPIRPDRARRVTLLWDGLPAHRSHAICLASDSRDPAGCGAERQTDLS
jgi:hypothetical protein